MSKLKSGVYFVRYHDIKKFFQDIEKNGWKNGGKHTFENPQAQAYNTLRERGRDSETIKELVIPFSLDREKRRVGYWSQTVCFESDVEETMKAWSDYG